MPLSGQKRNSSYRNQSDSLTAINSSNHFRRVQLTSQLVDEVKKLHRLPDRKPEGFFYCMKLSHASFISPFWCSISSSKRTIAAIRCVIAPDSLKAVAQSLNVSSNRYVIAVNSLNVSSNRCVNVPIWCAIAL